MNKILRRKVFRHFKKNAFRYSLLFLLIVMGMYLVVSIVNSAETVIVGVNKKSIENNLEDGQFKVFAPLTEKQLDKLKDDGVDIEKTFYIDYTLDDKSTLRIFRNRKNINLIDIDQGRLSSSENEIVLEKRYSDENKLKVNDSIDISGKLFKIVGIASTPDYNAPYKEMSDSSVDSKIFATGFVTDKQYNKLIKEKKYSKAEEYVYSYKLNGKKTNEELKSYLKKTKVDTDKIKDIYIKEMVNDAKQDKTDIENTLNKLEKGASSLEEGLKELSDNNLLILLSSQQLPKQYDSFKQGLREYLSGEYSAYEGAEELSDGVKILNSNANKILDKFFKDIEIDNLTYFLAAEDNPRIKAAIDDFIINIYAGIVSGIIIMILFTYVISVFVINEIDKENSIIGVLYALGVSKNDLIKHYLTLPVIISVLGGITGLLLGFSKYGTEIMMESGVNYYSMPKLNTVYPIYLIIYGVVMPPIIAIVVNYLVINKKLSKPVLKLIRNERKNNKVSKVNLEKLPFIRKFQIRQFLREKRCCFTMIFGMFISLLITILSMQSYQLCNEMETDSKKDTKYEYMYNYKYPTKDVIKGGEACYIENLEKENLEYKFNVSLIGIDNNNPYFDYKVANSKSEIVISSMVSKKFNISKGDTLVLDDKDNDVKYAFEVKDIVENNTGLSVFMNIDKMRDLFNQQDDYYNTVFSSKQLNIESDRLYSIVSKEDIISNAKIFIDHMVPLVVMFVSTSIIIFCIVMYLMMKIMIDKSSQNISLMKVFGFKDKEVNNLYIKGNFFTVAIGGIICIPLAQICMNKIYPYLIYNVAVAAKSYLDFKIYICIYVGIIVFYLIVNKILIRRISKIPIDEILKDR